MSRPERFEPVAYWLGTSISVRALQIQVIRATQVRIHFPPPRSHGFSLSPVRSAEKREFGPNMRECPMSKRPYIFLRETLGGNWALFLRCGIELFCSTELKK